MDQRVGFTVTLDDLVDTMSLSTRRFAMAGAAAFGILGLAGAATGNVAGLVLAALAALVFVFWRFPAIDRWLLSKRQVSRIGTSCEVWLTDTGVEYRQTGMSGRFAWAMVADVLESDRSVILRHGSTPLIGIPKRAFASPAAAAEFAEAVRRQSGTPTAHGAS